MSGNSIGKLFTVTSFGESHGPALGCIVDGCPPGLPLSEEDLQADLDRRKPGSSRYTTQRKEDDTVKILSGVFEGKTTGTPIGMIIENQDQKEQGLQQDQGSIPACPCRLHLSAEIRRARLSWRRALFGQGNGHAGCCRRHCQKIPAGKRRHPGQRLSVPTRADQGRAG